MKTIRERARTRQVALSLDGRIDLGRLDRASPTALRRGVAVHRRRVGPHTAVEGEGLFPALTSDFPEQMAELSGKRRWAG